MQIRLNKFLSESGVASRREADRVIEKGRVTVNGQVVQVLGLTIDDEGDEVRVDGRRVKKEAKKVYLMLNKPPGYLVSLKDPFGRATIKDLLPSFETRIFPVGRLDYESQGLLLMTNDGNLAYRLTHPRYKIKKVYLLKIKGQPDSVNLTKLEKGVFLDGKRTAPAKIVLQRVSSQRAFLRIEVYEGRKREIRRMFESIGHRVLELRRIKLGGLSLGKLKNGQWRYLTPKEVERLKNQVGLE